VEERIRSRIHADLKPVRPLPSGWGAAGAALLLAVVISSMQAMTMGVAGWTALSPLQSGVLYSFSAGIIVLAANSLLTSIRPASRAWVSPLLPVLAFVLGFPLVVASLFPAGASDHFLSAGVRCLAGGLMITALTSGITYSLARRGYSVSWPRTGALIGVIGGAVAIAAQQVSCPDSEFGHLIVWHELTIVLSVTAGYLTGMRVERPAGVRGSAA
jgi:hypothetical protein